MASKHIKRSPAVSKAGHEKKGLGSGNADQAPPGDLQPDALLVDHVHQGDTQAFEQLVRRYQQKAYAIAFQMLDRDAEEASDATQQAFLNAFKNIHRFQKNAAFYTWFYRILVNTCLEARRRKQRWRRFFSVFTTGESETAPETDRLENTPDTTPGSSPDSGIEKQELHQALNQALEKLPQRQRDVFQLKVFQEMSLAEISKIMKIAPGTVKSHFFRAVRSVRESLADWQPTAGR
ncbi:MAG: sigma-70 family RNA polymerase sigma factor [Deltaproteobacteria bacterium]|nr:sigma-70 family RNA polymerase sigma factor [Deltaproteobacteria bacterium]